MEISGARCKQPLRQRTRRTGGMKSAMMMTWAGRLAISTLLTVCQPQSFAHDPIGGILPWEVVVGKVAAGAI